MFVYHIHHPSLMAMFNMSFLLELETFLATFLSFFIHDWKLVCQSHMLGSKASASASVENNSSLIFFVIDSTKV